MPGADLIGCCPFHTDKTPSLKVISPKKNLWHCLGACQAGGSVIDWVMRMQRVSFRHAVELLRNDPSLAVNGDPGGTAAPASENLASTGGDGRRRSGALKPGDRLLPSRR